MTAQYVEWGRTLSPSHFLSLQFNTIHDADRQIHPNEWNRGGDVMLSLRNINGIICRVNTSFLFQSFTLLHSIWRQIWTVKYLLDWNRNSSVFISLVIIWYLLFFRCLSESRWCLQVMKSLDFRRSRRLYCIHSSFLLLSKIWFQFYSMNWWISFQ